MKQTKLRVCLLGISRLNGHLSKLVVVIALLFCAVIQGITAQTLDDLGPTRGESVYMAIMDEIKSLNDEASDDNFPPTSGIKIDYNYFLVEYYEYVGSLFRMKEFDIKDAFRRTDMLTAKTSVGGATPDLPYDLGDGPFATKKLDPFKQIVDQMQLEHNNDDLHTAFDFLRMLKNQ